MSSDLSAPNSWYQLDVTESGNTLLRLTGNYTLSSINRSYALITKELTGFIQTSDTCWDLTLIQQLDYAGAVMLWQIWGKKCPKHLLLRPEQQRMFARLEELPSASEQPKHQKWLPVSLLGKNLILFFDHLTNLVTLSGQIVLDFFYLIRHPRRIPLREISANLYRTGAQALGITAIVGFLIGIVLSYLTSEQLHMFGADIYIVNILGMSIIRELGPMLAAILVAGRSGSSMTAQLGVMRVTEELDALTVMGIPHSLRLVLPKIVGLGIALPLIVVWTSAIALLGGFIAADLQIGLSIRYALTVLPDSVPIANLWLALGKGIVCGMAIALIACHFGLRIRPDTESLGAGTTSSVVTSITAVILIDAVFAVAFSHIGIQISA